jgi:CRP/FNR family cyclic AMP-dependent transcriptional regulator
MKAVPFQALAGTRVFRDLPSAVLERLAAASEQMSLAPDELLLSNGRDRDHDVYVVVDGRLSVFRETPGEVTLEVTLGEVGPGDLVGEFAAISGQAGSGNVKAAMPSVVVRVPREQFLALVREHPQVALRLLEHLIGLVRSLDERVIALKSLDHAVESALKRLFLATL